MQEAVNQDGRYLIQEQTWLFNWTTILAQVQILGESDFYWPGYSQLHYEKCCW